MALEHDVNLDNAEGKNVGTLRQKNADKQSELSLNADATRIREGILQRMTHEKGVISKEEEEEWKNKLMDAKEDTVRTQRLKHEFEAHMRESSQAHERFDTMVHGAEKEGWLDDGEHEKLDREFDQSRLEQKLKIAETLEKTLGERQKEIADDLKGIRKDILKNHEKALKESKSWKEKHKEAHDAREHNEQLEEYLKALKKYPIDQEKIEEFGGWFAEAGKDMQKRALTELDKVMAPYVETWEDHNQLPKAHQDANFKSLGRRERERWLARKEKDLERDFENTLHEKAHKYFSKGEMDNAEKMFNKRETNRGERLKRKAQFLDALPGHIKAAQKLHELFEKLEPEIKPLYEKEFKKLDFEGKQKLLEETIPKESKVYLDYGRRMSKLDGHVHKKFVDDFDDAEGLKEKGEIVSEAEKFQTFMEKHQDLRKGHATLFNSPPERSRELFLKDVDTAGEAEKAYQDLVEEIKKRDKVHSGIKQLPPFLRDRMELKAPFEKITDQYKDLLEIKKAYDVSIPFMIKTGEKAELEGDETTALNSYMTALKLDPESKDLQKMVAKLVQKGVTPGLTPSSPIDAQKQEEIMAQIEGMPKIENETYELAREKLFLDLAIKHKATVGATGDTVEARRDTAKKLMIDDDAETTEDLEEKDLLKDHTVDETGKIRTIKKVKIGSAQNKETEDALQEMMASKVPTSEAPRGLADIEMVQQDGATVISHQEAKKQLTEKGQQVETEVIDLATALLQREHGFTKKRAKEFQATMKLRRSRTQAVEDQKNRLAS